MPPSCEQDEDHCFANHLLQRTSIRAFDNGEKPAWLTSGSACSSGGIFGRVLLAPGFHSPRFALAFARCLLSPSAPFSLYLLYIAQAREKVKQNTPKIFCVQHHASRRDARLRRIPQTAPYSRPPGQLLSTVPDPAFPCSARLARAPATSASAQYPSMRLMAFSTRRAQFAHTMPSIFRTA